jgi:DNA-directed RNA polymerase subunit RPC12/RpoP
MKQSTFKTYKCKKCGMEYSLEVESDEKDAIFRCVNTNLNKSRICGGVLFEIK